MIRKTLQSALCLCLSPLLLAQQTIPPGASQPKTHGPILRQSVRMVVDHDVTTVDGIVVIPKGTLAMDKVHWVRKAIPKKKDGEHSIKPVDLDLSNSSPVALRETSEGDALGTALLPILPFCIVGELIAAAFRGTCRRKHEEGKDTEVEACSEHWAELSTTVIEPNGVAGVQAAPPEIDLDRACPAGVRTNPLLSRSFDAWASRWASGVEWQS